MNDSSSPLLPTYLQGFDWKKPDYKRVALVRQKNLDMLRKDPGIVQAVKEFYKEDHYVEFIRDWGMMRDPRLAAEGRNPIIPFIPFPRQIELLHWFHRMVLEKSRGNVDKTRDCGASWCAISYAIWRFDFFENNDIGFGSSKEENIDSKGNPKALFPKARMLIHFLPKELRPHDWNERRDSPYLKLLNPENGSTIVGEGGDNIGRGGRTLIYFVDEHAHVERPHLAEGALSENTNTQINISTHFGAASLFYKQCISLPPSRLFEFDWKDDPRKDQAWYDRKKNDPITDPVIFAQEVDRDVSASTSDGFIELSLVEDAFKKGPADVIASGPFIISVDVADVGNDSSIINTRRGAINFEQKKFAKKESDQLAAEVERHCRKLLQSGQAPLGAIIFELAGPGYGFKVAMQNGPFRSLLRPIHPQAQLRSREFYNERARFWQLALEWLEEGEKSIVPDRKFRIQATSLRYEYKVDAKSGSKKLLIEAKKDYKKRLAADPRNKMAGPSPDEADAWAMSFAPVRLSAMVQPDSIDVLDGMFAQNAPDFAPLDSAMGY